MTRQDDLKELGLSEAEVTADSRSITRRYRDLARKRHPDKPGGSKEAFQQLVNAYERLTTVAAASASYHETTGGTAAPPAQEAEVNDQEEEGPDFEGFWYDQHYHFFRRAQEAQDENFYYDEYFNEWHSARRQEYKRRRGEADYRDQEATFPYDTCMFCGKNMAITKEQAEEHGLNWNEYDAHPSKYRTCWQCKNDHISVMTEKMAIKKFAKKLDIMCTSNKSGCEYRPIFWFLKCDKKSFHHQPKTDMYDGPTKNSEYFWYPDLEEEARARGWEPRGAKKGEVPWKRKDVRHDKALAIVTPERAQKKRKRS